MARRERKRSRAVDALSRAFDTPKMKLVGPIRFALAQDVWDEGMRICHWEEEAPNSPWRNRAFLSSGAGSGDSPGSACGGASTAKT